MDQAPTEATRVEPPSFLTRLFQKTPPVPEERPESWEHEANAPSKALFTWSFRLVRTAVSRRLEIEDFPVINPDRTCQSTTVTLRRNLDHFVKIGARQPLMRAIEKTCRRSLWLALALAVATLLIDYANIIVLYYFFSYLLMCREAHLSGQVPPSYALGVMYITVTCAVQAIVSVLSTHGQYLVQMAAAEIKATLIGVLSAKSFLIDPNSHVLASVVEDDSNVPNELHQKDSTILARKAWTHSRIMTLATIHSERCSQVFANIIRFTAALLNLPVVAAFAGWQLGWIAAPVIGVSVAIELIAFVFVFKAAKYQDLADDQTDSRVSALDGMLRGIRLIKMFGWENSFYKMITASRRQEIALYKSKTLYCALFAGFHGLSIFCAALTGHAIYASRNDLAGSRAITIMAVVYLIMDRHAWKLTLAAQGLVSTWASVGRCTNYLSSREYTAREQQVDPDFAIRLDKARFAWQVDHAPRSPSSTDSDVEKASPDHDSHVTEFRMAPLSISLGLQELVAVVGPIQAGKSSLLYGLIGDMPLRGGDMFINGTPSYCPQESWIQTATVMDNILFGLPHDVKIYDSVLDGCALKPDIATYPQGDKTALGERGIPLSGGQKSRLHLARTLYQALMDDRGVVLLDDPLKDVDARTSNIMFDDAILGLLKRKCRILVTHELHVLSRCDRVIYMQDGKILANGTYEQLMTMPSFATFVGKVDQSKAKDVDSSLAVCESAQGPEDKADARAETSDGNENKFFVEEERAAYRVPWSLYSEYLGGPRQKLALLGVHLLLVGSQLGFALKSLAVGWWNSNTYDLGYASYLGLYFSLGALNNLTWGPYEFSIQRYLLDRGFTSSTNALGGVLRAPITFFEERTIATLINRFSHDLHTLDQVLGFSYWFASLTVTVIFGLLGVIAAYVPIVLALLLPWALSSFFIFTFYKAAPLEIKRLSVNLSAKYLALYSEGLSGRTSIILANHQASFRRTLYKQIDSYQSVQLMSCGSYAWASLTNNLLYILVMYSAGFLILRIRLTESPAILIIVFAMTIACQEMLYWTLDTASVVQNGVNSVERLKYYADSLPDEGERVLHRKDNPRLEKAWPAHGNVSFRNVCLRYKSDLRLVLDGLSMDIKAGEKIGIVGRTGAGKSTILMALLRLVELAAGEIIIDGHDIAKLGLHDVRHNIGSIPQDPVLFVGTVRFNLDPAGEISDDRLMKALSQVHLIGDGAEGKIGSLTLDTHVEREGNNLSSGQRQLLSLARALAKDSKIIIVDEATSSVDLAKDELVQRTIREAFADCTVLTIAHRLRTVLQSDRICVMDSGRVAEMGTPIDLFRMPEGGLFRTLCQQARISEKDF